MSEQTAEDILIRALAVRKIGAVPLERIETDEVRLWVTDAHRYVEVRVKVLAATELEFVDSWADRVADMFARKAGR